MSRATEAEEPTDRPYGIDCALRDPFGNHIRIGQIFESPDAAGAEMSTQQS